MRRQELGLVFEECAKTMAKKKTFLAVDGPNSPLFVLAQIFSVLTIGMLAAIVTLIITLGFTPPPNFDGFTITILLAFSLPFILATVYWSNESVGATLYKIAHIAAFIWALHILLAMIVIIGVGKWTFELEPVVNLSAALIVFSIVVIRFRRWEKVFNEKSEIEARGGSRGDGND